MDKIDTIVAIKAKALEHYNLGDYDYAIANLEKLAADHTDDIELFKILGDSYRENNKNDISLKYYSRVIELDPINTENLVNYSKLKLKGPWYIDALKLIHKKIKPKKYIEIGVFKGFSFCLADEDTIAVGIDPEPLLDLEILPLNHSVFEDISDNYFESSEVKKEFGKTGFDLAFLDGMHVFEFALRDFINLERYSHKKSVICIHDLYPMNAETSTRDRNSVFWSGDVWKLVLCLKEYCPHLSIEVLPCAPTGLGVITGLDSKATILKDHYKEIIEKYENMPFSVIETDKDKKLNLVECPEWLA